MRKSLLLFALLSVLLISYTLIAQDLGLVRKIHETPFPQKISKHVLDPLPAGTYSIGTSGYFPTIDSAFNRLGIDGIAGTVTLELIDELYQAENNSYFLLEGPIQGADSNNRVIIRPAVNKNVVVQGNAFDVFFFKDVSYLTFDGIGTTGSTTLIVRSLSPYATPVVFEFRNNSDYNIIRNITVINENYYYGVGIYMWVGWGGTDNSPDYNLIENNFIKEAGVGILLRGERASNPVKRPKGNIIRGNSIGSESDSLIAWGIQSEVCQNTIIENNIVQNVRNYRNFVCPSINAFGDHGSIIRNNVIHNVYDTCGSEWGVHGISLTGHTDWMGVDNLVYNNMIYDINGTSPLLDKEIAGIKIWCQINPGIYFNSVNLSGMGPGYNGSAALYIRHNCTNVKVSNNIFVNTRIDAPKCASAIFIYTGSTLDADYNDFYYESNQYNCLVNTDTTDYLTLQEWQGTGNDLHSYAEMPNFIEPHLHIDETIATYLESRGTPIAGIEKDFEGDMRDAETPDIGADEFEGILVGVKGELLQPKEYVLEQNYPNPFNPSTKIKYSIPNVDTRHASSLQMVTLKVYDVLGNEIETLVNKEKPAGTYEVTWYPNNLPSGVYFYQIQAGSFIETKKMVLLR